MTPTLEIWDIATGKPILIEKLESNVISIDWNLQDPNIFLIVF